MSRPGPHLRRLFLSLCLLPLAAHALESPIPRGKPKQIIRALEQQYRAAALAANSVELDRLLSDDYVGISWNGQVSTKLMQLDRIRNHSLILTRLDLSDEKVKIVGPVAIVTSIAQIDGTNDGNELHGTFRYTRIYQRLPSGAWKITNFEATRVPNPANRPLLPPTAATAPPTHPFLSR